MIDLVSGVIVLLTVPLLLIGVLELAYYPVAVLAEVRRRHQPVFESVLPLVSVIVPAYNEERVLASCVESIIATRYPRKEIILVDDGSTDRTLAVMRQFAYHPDVMVLTQRNGGKAAALNTGIRLARGEICCFVDADGVFTADTISQLLLGFDSATVGGVCGNDEPVNLDRHQTRLLALLTHATALVRRALAQVGCLTIVSGNCGAFRRRVVQEVGGFETGTLGEDLELTWRVRAAGYRINFQPRAMVYAEVPSTVSGLWRQRIRWTRGLVQTARRHRDLVGSRRHGRLGWYLVYNLVTMLAVPPVQLLTLGLVLLLAATGQLPSAPTVPALVLWIGLGAAAAHTLVAIALDRAWRDLRLLYILPAAAIFSVFSSVVTVRALWLEARGAPMRWNKLDRTGVRSRSVAG
ncbi:glycosyltransferase [Micromonospora sp. NBC_01796]|uniref:glycosyltransferase n=1 Tax=Micromonospora sp. NBC_01796 TaxID=2975987 RepID=UPI002DDC280B|nr:glycosyltransferase family 2 protein [Micromonospora sp. NBC_01796]WSA88170.1 glycosyltransferase family 2 protein [Micromonospora sp. NBC_01796]